MEFFGSPCSLNNAPVEGFENVNTASNAELISMYSNVLNRLNANSDLLGINQIELDKLAEIKDPVAMRNILWSLITSVYKYNSQVLDSNMEEMERAEELIEEQRKSAQHDETIMNEINGLNLTNKRKINIENFAFEKTMYQLSFLKKVLIALGVLILLPILRIVGVIGKGLALTIYFVVLVVLILYGVYQLYYKSLNRDENDFNKFNFGKPDEKQVLMSRLNSRMSEADRQRCMEMEEVGGDLNPDSLIIPKHKIDEWKADTCRSPIVSEEEDTTTPVAANSTESPGAPAPAPTSESTSNNVTESAEITTATLTTAAQTTAAQTTPAATTPAATTPAATTPSATTPSGTTPAATTPAATTPAATTPAATTPAATTPAATTPSATTPSATTPAAPAPQPQ